MEKWFNSACSAFLARVMEGYGYAIALSLILHTILFGVLLVNWSSGSNARIIPPMSISVALIERPKPVQGQAEKKRKEEEVKRQVDAKAKAKRKAEQQRKEQERQKALALKREKERKKEVLRQKEEAAKKLQEQEMREREREQRHKEQEALERVIAMEQQALKDAQQLEHDQLEQARYVALIKSLISQYWNRPPSARNNMVTEVRINLSPFGDVLDITMLISSGNDEFDRSVIQAIQRAAPLSELKDMDRRVFDQYFRRITFRFRPEDLVR